MDPPPATAVKLCSDIAPDAVLSTPKDVIFAADGKNSVVRRSAGLESSPQLQLPDQPSPPLSQLTLILHFDGIERSEGWECPSFDETVGPYDTWKGVPGVTAAFKRMWWPYCEMQLLFSERTARTIAEGREDNRALELALRRLFSLLGLEKRIGRSSAYTDYSRSSSSPLISPTTPPLPPAAKVLLAEHRAAVAYFGRIRIDRASASSAVLPGNVLVALRGDALVTAHYRLGIGVNEAFSGLPHVSKLLNKWPSPSPFSLPSHKAMKAIRSAWDTSIGARADTMVQRQLEAIYWEAFCGFVVWNDEPLRRDEVTGHYHTATASQRDACARLWKVGRGKNDEL